MCGLELRRLFLDIIRRIQNKKLIELDFDQWRPLSRLPEKSARRDVEMVDVSLTYDERIKQSAKVRR